MVSWTYTREDNHNQELYDDDNILLSSFTELFHDFTKAVSLALDDICEDIFNHQGKDVENIDLTLKLEEDDTVSISLLNDGKEYNPLSNPALMELESIKDLDTLHPNYDFNVILGFNRTYIKIDEDNIRNNDRISQSNQK